MLGKYSIEERLWNENGYLKAEVDQLRSENERLKKLYEFNGRELLKEQSANARLRDLLDELWCEYGRHAALIHEDKDLRERLCAELYTKATQAEKPSSDG